MIITIALADASIMSHNYDFIFVPRILNIYLSYQLSSPSIQHSTINSSPHAIH